MWWPVVLQLGKIRVAYPYPEFLQETLKIQTPKTKKSWVPSLPLEREEKIILEY